MTGVRPGWHPHNPQLLAGNQHPSWQDLADTWPRCRATSFRRFWNGSEWDGSHIANNDLVAIAVCPGCKRQTGFIALAIEEEMEYIVGFFQSGILHAVKSAEATQTTSEGMAIKGFD